MAGNSCGCFAGRRILVVEDDYFLAMAFAEELQVGGAAVVGPFSTLAAGLDFIASRSPVDEAPVDGAVLDVQLQTALVWPLAEALLARQVPMVFVTHYPADHFPAPFVDLPRRGKVVRCNDLFQALFGSDCPA